jgi:Dihaem cytochrome c
MRRLPHGFPSRMLPGRSWTAILSKMDDHFGEDAAIPKGDLDVIRDFLTSHAADSPDATVRERHYLGALLPDSTPLRITATPWWNQVHADFDFDGVKHSQVKSPANCLACHNTNNVVQ